MEGFKEVKMKIWVILLLVLGLCVGGVRANIKAEEPTEPYTLQSLIEKAKTLEPDEDGWRTLAIPHKNFGTNYIEFLVFIKGESWGIGFVQHGTDGASGVVEYNSIDKGWYTIINERDAIKIPPEEADRMIKELWVIMLRDGDFSKMRRFTILIPMAIKEL
jgi:hypothetical protein